ncbi:MAG: hypothetical protein M1337_08590, partial [Actinobacteria bacterium]|nr:hypothetical protein [Actinomycetota bacterium]
MSALRVPRHMCVLGASLAAGALAAAAFPPVGLGWSCINVASTAVIADTTQPHERGRAVGTIDVFASGAAIV